MALERFYAGASGAVSNGARGLTVEDLAALEPGLLLFTAFVVRGLAEDAASAAGAGAATSTTTMGG
jgi:hypothetical protein